MKKIFFLLLSALLLSACSSDDPKFDDPNAGGGGNGGTGTEGGTTDNTQSNYDTSPFDDWNSKSSKNYKPEGYNPILGEWTDQPPGSTFGYKIVFTEDFKYYRSSYSPSKGWDTPRNHNTYKVNNKVFKTGTKQEVSNADPADRFPYELGTSEKGIETLTVKYPNGKETYYRYK